MTRQPTRMHKMIMVTNNIPEFVRSLYFAERLSVAIEEEPIFKFIYVVSAHR